jgi:hypothetical protein
MEVSSQLQAPAAYSQGKSHCYPLDMSLGGPQSRSGCGGEDKNSQLSPGIEPLNPDRPAHSPALYRLSCHGSWLYRWSLEIFTVSEKLNSEIFTVSFMIFYGIGYFLASGQRKLKCN